MASEETSRTQGVSDLNAVGTAEYVGQRMGVEEGGNNGRGYIDQPMPTAITARGQEVSSRDDFRKGVRGGMSAVRNDSIARGERGREMRR